MSADPAVSGRSGHGKMSDGADTPLRRDAGAEYDGDAATSLYDGNAATSLCVSADLVFSDRSGHGKKSDGADTPLRRDAGAENDGDDATSHCDPAVSRSRCVLGLSKDRWQELRLAGANHFSPAPPCVCCATAWCDDDEELVNHPVGDDAQMEDHYEDDETKFSFLLKRRW